MISGIYNEEEESDETSLRPKPVKRIKLEDADSRSTSATSTNTASISVQNETSTPSANATAQSSSTNQQQNESFNQTQSDQVPKTYTRQDLLEYFEKEFNKKRESYVDNLLELFFLEENGNLTEYYTWRKKAPTVPLLQYFKLVAKDNEQEFENLQIIKASLDGANPNSIKIVPISNIKLPAPDIQQPQSSNQQSFSANYLPNQQTQSSFAASSSNSTSLSSTSNQNTTNSSIHSTISTQFTTPSTSSFKLNVDNQHPHSSKPRFTIQYSSSHLSKQAQTSSSNSQISKSLPSTPIGYSISKKSSRFHVPTSSYASSTISSSSPHTFHQASTPTVNISHAFDGFIPNPEQNTERANHENEIQRRVNELRKEGLWSAKRLPKIQEPQRGKAHWDYLLEEMTWLATDFAQERKWKKAAAKKCARMIMKHSDKESQVEKAEKENQLRLKKIASTISKEIRQFWSSVEKLVEFKIQTKLEEKRKKALDVHLSYIVDQTEKYTEWLAEGLNLNPSSKEQQEEQEDEEKMSVDEEDNESNVKEATNVNKTKDDDGEFNLSSDEEDFEDTIAEQEKHEGKQNHDQELKDLEDEANIPIEKLLERYMDACQNEESMDVDEQSEDDEEDETTMNDETDENDQSDDNEADKQEIGVEYLINLKDDSTKSVCLNLID